MSSPDRLSKRALASKITQGALRFGLGALGTVLVILLMAGLPLVAVASPSGVSFEPLRIPKAILGFLAALADGSVFLYKVGYTQWDLRQIGPAFLRLSFLYTALPGALGLSLGCVTGAALRAKRRGLMDVLCDGVLALPDFLLIFLVQLGAAWLVRKTSGGIGLGRGDHLLSPLPLALMTLYPLFLSWRIAARTSRRCEGEAYIAYARAKGLPEGTILARHLGAALIPALEADLPIIIAFMQGSLFFTEKAFGLPGMARFLFDSGFAGRKTVLLRAVYQYDYVVLALLGLMVSCIATWVLLRLALALARKVLTHE